MGSLDVHSCFPPPSLTPSVIYCIPLLKNQSCVFIANLHSRHKLRGTGQRGQKGEDKWKRCFQRFIHWLCMIPRGCNLTQVKQAFLFKVMWFHTALCSFSFCFRCISMMPCSPHTGLRTIGCKAKALRAHCLVVMNPQGQQLLSIVLFLFFKGFSGGRCALLNSDTAADEEEQYWGVKPSEKEEEWGPEGREKTSSERKNMRETMKSKQGRDKNNRESEARNKESGEGVFKGEATKETECVRR